MHRRHLSRFNRQRVDWMNDLVAEMWPYLNKAISEQIREIGTPILKAQQPAFIETLEFQEIDLGTIPPAVLAIKSFDTTDDEVILQTALPLWPSSPIKSFDTTDDEVILQTALRWAANNNIIVAASAKGFTGTVQITDLQVAAVTRITLKPLMPIFPCFSTITVSFMDKPQVDFGLKVVGLDVMAIPGLYTYVQVSVELAGCFTFEGPQSLKVVGLAVMAIPGLYTYVQKTIGNVAASMYMWPKVLEVYDDQPLPTPTCASPIDGRALGRRSTSVKKDDLDPDWGKEELLVRVADLQKQKLHIEVFDKSFTSTQQLPLVDPDWAKEELLVRVCRPAEAEAAR
ncbi:unnamed protein product [Closterium sp. NIES-65]|nr:unnamed protein product [Closterium sp. NIES-65]